MANTETVRAALKSMLESVPNIGVVHGYERFSAQQAGFQALYKSNGKLLGWQIHRQAFSEELIGSPRLYRVEANWIITGLMALSDVDESEIVFDGLIDAIAAEFSADPSLGGVVCTEGQGMRLQSSGPVMFAGVLCHWAKLSLTTIHEEFR